MVDFNVPLDLKFSVWGLAVSQSEIKIKDDIVFNPGYFVLNAVIYKRVKKFEIFLKGENLLNSFYTTEPGYPMKSRTIAFGFRAELSGTEKNN